MNKMESLCRWRDNPANPKNIQIPFYLLVAMKMVLEMIDKNTLSDDEKAVHELLRREIEDKERRIANRLEYTEVVRTPKGEKQAALDTYHKAKKFNQAYYK